MSVGKPPSSTAQPDQHPPASTLPGVRGIAQPQPNRQHQYHCHAGYTDDTNAL